MGLLAILVINIVHLSLNIHNLLMSSTELQVKKQYTLGKKHQKTAVHNSLHIVEILGVQWLLELGDNTHMIVLRQFEYIIWGSNELN